MAILGIGIGLILGFFMNAKITAIVRRRTFLDVCEETAPAYFSLASVVAIGALFATKVFS